MKKVILLCLMCLFGTAFSSLKTQRSAELGNSGSDSDDYSSSDYSGEDNAETSGGGSFGGGSYGRGTYSAFGGGSNGAAESYGGSYRGYSYGTEPQTTAWTPVATGSPVTFANLAAYNGGQFGSQSAYGVSHIAVPMNGVFNGGFSGNFFNSISGHRTPYLLNGAANNFGHTYNADNSYSSSDSGGQPAYNSYDFGRNGENNYGNYGGGGFFNHHTPAVHETTKTIPVHKTIRVPVPHPVPHPVAVPVPVKIPQPYAVKIPYPIPVEKTVQVPVEKIVHYPVEKPVPVKVIKKVPVPVIKPYPVPVPVYKVKYIYHSKKHDEHED